ncbi:hypothetical protein G3T36_06615 [Diaminobutyricibacter tongyongensis]|uniref:YtxH domain-containing protein n=1 Tax=Leifsonia tongyongensis TaxID=1268043 RepID=A0A6L9XVT1_9MICO|nr:hypothetical protein [Diaminobutyricibacter tongyongensis]NEN05541.1 hypothetical protein [Diaminobutyricibacter tongyongensis]
MRGKLLFVAGAAVGYVLGARAGRKRYEQIKSAATKVWETPGIQKQVNAVEDYAAARFGELPGALFEGTKKVVTQVVNRAQAAQKQNAANRAPSAPPAPTRSYTSSVTIAAPPDEETANAPVTPPSAAASKPAASGGGAKKRKSTASDDIDEADDAGA